MKSDIAAKIGVDWVASQGSLFDLIPNWPHWAELENSYHGRLLITPTFVTTLHGIDYAIGQQVGGLGSHGSDARPRLQPALIVWRLTRRFDEEFPGWGWERLRMIPVDGISDGDVAAQALAQARTRLLDLVTEASQDSS